MNDTWYDMGFDADMSWMYDWKGKEKKMTSEETDEIIKTLEPKTGYWILQPSNKEHGERDFVWWKCSECGQVIFSESESDRREFHAFCGRCGAKMEEEKV